MELNSLVNNIHTVIKSNIEKEVDDFNTAMTSSAEYKNRSKSIEDENTSLLLIRSTIDDYNKLAKELTEGNEKLHLEAILDYSESQFYNIKTKLLKEEFGILHFWSIWQSNNCEDLLYAKLKLANSGDLDSIIDELTLWIKDKMKLYI